MFDPDSRLTLLDPDSRLTLLARQIRTRARNEVIVLGDWRFQVGEDGFDPMNPDDVIPVDIEEQSLGSPIGGLRHLGLVEEDLDTFAPISGASAAVAPAATAGYLTVTGLAGIPVHAGRRWLTLSGSADVGKNGLWKISRWISATSVEIYAPLAVGADAGPLAWELRRAVMGRPNARALSFYSRFVDTDLVGETLGEVGIFCRVLRSDTDPDLLGQTILFAVGHYPAIIKTNDMFLGRHVVVQE